MTSTEYKEQLSAALRKIGGMLPLGFEYTRLTGQNAPIGGVDYMGQTATRAMYADLWTWLNEHKPDAIISESEWQILYASQNGNVAKYSTGDGSTTFRFPRVVGYFKGAGSTDELGQYIKEGLPNITGQGWNRHGANASDWSGAFYATNIDQIASSGSGSDVGQGSLYFDASRSNPIYGNSSHVTPETVAIVMGVIAFGSVASIGEATEEGIVAELGEHGAKLGELEAEVDEKFSTVIPAGFVMPFAANSTPSGYLLCNGAAVSRTTYTALYAAIGTTYGEGDGSTTFNLPQLSDGRFIRGESAAGNYYEAGLPNITGSMQPSDGRGGSYSGAIYRESYSGWTEKGTEGTDYTWKFDASRSSTLYGRHATVMPDALSMRYYIKY